MGNSSGKITQSHRYCIEAYRTHSQLLLHLQPYLYTLLVMTKIVKICGLKTLEDAAESVKSGADLLGFIMVPGRKRSVDPNVAAEISSMARSRRRELNRPLELAREVIEYLGKQQFLSYKEYFATATRVILENGPFSVGVFRNQNPEEVFQKANELKLDIIQLHGSEDPETFMNANKDQNMLIIKRFVIPSQVEYMEGFFQKLLNIQAKGFLLPLLDSELGGEGVVIDWSMINDLNGSFILAGGLKPENLNETKPFLKNVVGFDVSGGVEDDRGNKDLNKIADFVNVGKSL